MPFDDPILQSLLASADALLLDPVAPPVAPPPIPAVASAPVIGGGLFPDHQEGTVHLSSKIFAVIVVDCLDKTLCFGSIGAGGSICVKRNCAVKSHSSSKARFLGLESSAVFIQRSTPGVVFSEPHLDAQKVPSEVLGEWKRQRLSLNEWTLEFQAVETTNDVLASAEDIKEETSFLTRADKVKTPSKKRREFDEIMESDFVVLGWRGEAYQKILPEEGSAELESRIATGFKKGDVTRVVAGVESKLESMSKGMVELSQLTHNRFITIEESVRFCNGILQTMKSKMGREFDVHEKFEAPTLWGTTSFIADELNRVDTDVASLIGDLNPLKRSMEVVMKYIDDSGDLKGAVDKLVKIVSIMMTRIQSLSPEIKSMQSELQRMKLAAVSVTQSRRAFQSRGASGHEESASAVDELMSQVCDDYLGTDDHDSSYHTPMRQSNASGGRMPSKPPSLMIEGGKSLPIDDVLANDDHSVIIRQLLDDVRSLKSTSEDTSIKFGNLGFRNIHECSTWIEKNFAGLRYGLIMDPLLMLERIYGDDEVDAVSLMKTLESRLKLKIETGAEASALNALRHSRPRIFHKGRPTMVNSPNKSRLNLLPSHSDWKSGGEGVKAFIVRKMNILHSSIAADIAFEFGRNPSTSAAQMVATLSLTATITFITQLLGMVDTMYERLFAVSKFSSEQAWSLTTQVLDRVLSDLYAPKDGIGESLTTRSPLSICAHLMWGSFKTHDVMTQYVTHNFENHPAVSTEYVKFLATNSGSDKVTKLMDQVEAMKTKVATATEEAKRAVSKADTASTKNAELVREVASLTKRLKALEDKGGK